MTDKKRILQRLGCVFGLHLWARWNYYRSDAASGWALYKHRRCIVCGRYQDDVLTRVEADHANQPTARDPATLHYDPG